MIVDEIGVILTPGNSGKDCCGNGTHILANGSVICCCDECSYLLCCISSRTAADCTNCTDAFCPHAEAHRQAAHRKGAKVL